MAKTGIIFTLPNTNWVGIRRRQKEKKKRTKYIRNNGQKTTLHLGLPRNYVNR